MTLNLLKLAIAGALALACILALALDADANRDWAAPVLGILIGYVVGNAQVTSQTGVVAPIIGRSSGG
jgi:hypothetical protein